MLNPLCNFLPSLREGLQLQSYKIIWLCVRYVTKFQCKKYMCTILVAVRVGLK